MWISKKEYNRLVDENLELKKKIEEMEDINEAIKEVKERGKSFIKHVNKNYYLVNVFHFNRIIDDVKSLTQKLVSNRKELEYYKQLYANELQKRLELAEMVRKMDGE